MQKQLLFLFGLSFMMGCATRPTPTSYERSVGYEAINETYMAGKNGVVLRKNPRIYTQICKNIRVGDTLYVYGRLNFNWLVVRRNGKRYFAPSTGLYSYSAWQTREDNLKSNASTQSAYPYGPGQNKNTGLRPEK